MKYGIFKVIARYKEHKGEMLWRIFQEFCIKESVHSHYMINLGSTSGLADDRNDELLKTRLAAWKAYQKNESKLSRCHYYSTKYFIHQCDEVGYFIPTKAELKEAIKIFGEAYKTDLNIEAQAIKDNL